MKMHGLNRLTGLGLASLCLAWSGLTYAGGPPPGFVHTTVSKASVNIQSYRQSAEGEVEKIKIDTPWVINSLTGSDQDTKPAKNLQLVLLNYCDEPEGGSALAVWDKDTNDLAEGADVACLDRESSVIYNDKKDTVYQGLDIDAEYFHMDEIDMDVEIKGGKVKKNVLSDRPICLKKFKTMTMAGYYDNGDDGATDNLVMRKAGSIKTNGGVFEAILGNEVAFWCD